MTIEETTGKPLGEPSTKRAGDSQFRALIETALDVIAVLNNHGTLRYLSPSLQRVVGYLPEELIGESAFDYMHPDDAPGQLEHFMDVVSEPDRVTAGEPRSFRFRHKDGHWVVLESVSTKLPAGPEPPGIVVNARDVTDRTQAHEAMREAAAMEHRVAQESEVIAEVGRIVSSTLNIEEVFELFAAQVKRLIQFDIVVASIVDRSEQTATIRYWSGPTEPNDFFVSPTPLHGTLTREVLVSGQPVLVHANSDEEFGERFIHLYQSFEGGIRSWLGVPMVNRGQTIGALLLLSSELQAFSDQDIALAGRVSNQIAGAIDNAELFAGLKATETELASSVIERSEAAFENEVIAEIGRVISSTLELDDVYGLFAKQVRKLIDCDDLSIGIYDGETESVTIAYRTGINIEGREAGVRVHPKGSLTEVLIKTRAPHRVQGLTAQELKQQYPFLINSYNAGMRSWLGCPMINRGEFVGPIICHSLRENAFEERDVKLAQRVASQIAGAIDGARLYADLKKAEVDLAAGNDRYQMILETADDAFVSIDEKGEVIAWNPQAEETFGWSAAEAMHRLLSDLIIPDNFVGRHLAGIKAFLETGNGPVLNQRIELVAKHRDGHEFPVELTIAPLKLTDRYLFNAFVRDITERKVMEQEITHYTTTLETANRELQQLDRMKDEFISTVSHELRTPLTSIKGAAELLLIYDEEDRESQLEFLRIINNESDRLTRLTNDVLDLSRLESRQMPWLWEEVELADVVNQAVAGTRALSMQKCQSIYVELGSGLPHLWNDRDRLVQVVTNLLSNSIKFTPQGGEVWVSAKKIADEESAALGEMVEVCVSDTGIGIRRAEYEDIFQKFKQGGYTLSDKPKGTGLGLPICKQIVEYFGGKIWVESTPDKGSSFFFTVPVSAGEYVLSSDNTTTNPA